MEQAAAAPIPEVRVPALGVVVPEAAQGPDREVVQVRAVEAPLAQALVVARVLAQAPAAEVALGRELVLARGQVPELAQVVAPAQEVVPAAAPAVAAAMAASKTAAFPETVDRTAATMAANHHFPVRVTAVRTRGTAANPTKVLNSRADPVPSSPLVKLSKGLLQESKKPKSLCSQDPSRPANACFSSGLP